MKLNVFDVIELKNEEKVIIVEDIKTGYKVKDINNNEIYEIENSQIKEILHRNK